jgi:hypothetical protein
MMDAICVNDGDNFKSLRFRGRWFSGISPSDTLRVLLILACIPEFIFVLPDGMERLLVVSRTLSTCMAQVEAYSNFPQPGWFEKSSGPMIDPVKGMEMMLRPTTFCAIQ